MTGGPAWPRKAAAVDAGGESSAVAERKGGVTLAGFLAGGLESMGGGGREGVPHTEPAVCPSLDERVGEVASNGMLNQEEVPEAAGPGPGQGRRPLAEAGAGAGAGQVPPGSLLDVMGREGSVIRWVVGGPGETRIQWVAPTMGDEPGEAAAAAAGVKGKSVSYPAPSLSLWKSLWARGLSCVSTASGSCVGGRPCMRVKKTHNTQVAALVASCYFLMATE